MRGVKYALFFLLVACTKPVPKNAPEVAQCLIDNGTKMYGAFWCPHCKAQKDAFGDGVYPQAVYVECSHEDRSQKEECGGDARYFYCEPKTDEERARCMSDCATSGTCAAQPQRYSECEDKTGDTKTMCVASCTGTTTCTPLETIYNECEPKNANERTGCINTCKTSGTCEHIGGKLYEECQPLADDERNACTDECRKNGACTRIDIRGYPTWIFPSGERLTGEQSIQTLAKKGGC